MTRSNPLIIQILSNLGKEGNFLNSIKHIYQNPSANVMVNVDMLKTFLLNKARKILLITPFKLHIRELPNVIKEEQIKGKETGRIKLSFYTQMTWLFIWKMQQRDSYNQLMRARLWATRLIHKSQSPLSSYQQ